MLVLARTGDAYPDDNDASVRYRLPLGLQPVTAPNGMPQAVLTRSEDGGLLQLRLAALWPELAPGERPVQFTGGRFRLLVKTPTAQESGDWRETPVAGGVVVDRGISLTPAETAIARRLGQNTQDLVDVEVELDVRGFAPTFPWLASADTEMLKARVTALLGSGAATWDVVEAAFLGLTEDTFAWQPLEPGAIRPPRDAALLAIAHHAVPLFLTASSKGWTIADDAPKRLDLNLAVPVVQTESIGLRWSFSEFLAQQSDPGRHLVDVSIPAPFAASEVCIVNDVPLAPNGVRSIVVEVRTGGPTGALSHEFRPGEPSAARLSFVRQTADELNLQWRARSTVVTSGGPAALPPTEFRKTGLLIEATPAALGFKPVRLSCAPEAFDDVTSWELTLGSRTFALTRAAPETWAVGREPPASVSATAQLASGERKALGSLPLGPQGVIIDAVAVGNGEVTPVIVKPPADLATKAAYLAVQTEGRGWRTVDPDSEFAVPVRRTSRLQSPKIRYRTRHVPRGAAGGTEVLRESDWRDAAGETITVEF